MSYSPPAGTLDASWVGRPQYAGATSNVPASWGASILGPAGVAPGGVGTPTALQQLLIAPTGLPPGDVAAGGWVLHPEQYRTPQHVLHASWSGAQPYSAPAGVVTAGWGGRVTLSPAGIDPPEVPAPVLVWQQFAYPSGWASSAVDAGLSALHPWQYAPPRWIINASWVGKDPYSPPTGALNAAWALPQEAKQVSLTGWASSEVGQPSLALMLSVAAPSGIDAPAIPAPALRNSATKVLLGGWNSLSMGNGHSVVLYTRYLVPPGISAAVHGGARVEHGVRRITQAGASYLGMGTPWASHSPRSLSPAGVTAPAVLGSHQVGGLRFILPEGKVMTLWGSRIIPEIQHAYPLGFVGAVGMPAVVNRLSLVRPAGFRVAGLEEFRWGRAHAWNLRQFVVMAYDPDSELNPPAWPQWTKIENRNRIVAPAGWRAEAQGYTGIFNKARVVAPAGMPPPATPDFYRAGLVTHRVRPLPVDGIAPPYFGGWAVVFNSAALVRPAGRRTEELGMPQVVNTRRTFRFIGAIEPPPTGYPTVAFGVRRLEMESRYSIQPPVPPLPYVGLYTRYVEQVSAGEQLRTGLPALSIHWRIVTPRWTHRDFFGEPSLHNVTPELRTRGWVAEAIGEPAVRHQWRPVDPLGPMTALFGASRIADRRHWVFLPGIMAPLVDRPVVTKVGGLPDPQSISLINVFWQPDNPLPGHGIPPPGEQVPKPAINQQVVYPEGEDMARFGDALVRANSIRVVPGYFELLVAEPSVSLKNRVLTIEQGIPAPADPSRPRLSPHTIYAVCEPPPQARQNHPMVSLHYVDHEPLSNTPRWGVGMPGIQNRNRTVRPVGTAPLFNQVAAPGVRNRRHVIELRGFNMMRLGLPALPGTVVVEQFDSALTEAFGHAHVMRPPYVGPQTVRPAGFRGEVGEGSKVEFFDRAVAPAGWASSRTGASRPADTPYTWQSLNVGPRMPVVPGGYDAAVFGEMSISARVRELRSEGFLAEQIEYDHTAFEQRMRVRHATGGKPAPLRLSPAGVPPASRLGTPGMKPGLHFIRPDGNSDQFRKGAPS